MASIKKGLLSLWQRIDKIVQKWLIGDNMTDKGFKVVKAINGTVFYTLPINELPQSRAVLLQAIVQKMSLGIDKEDLDLLIADVSNEVVNATSNTLTQVKQKVVTKIANITDRIANAIAPDLLLTAAVVILYIDGESAEYEERYMAKKRKLIKDNENMKYFFLHFALTILTEHKNILLEELKNFVRQERMESQMNSVL